MLEECRNNFGPSPRRINVFVFYPLDLQIRAPTWLDISEELSLFMKHQRNTNLCGRG